MNRTREILDAAVPRAQQVKGRRVGVKSESEVPVRVGDSRVERSLRVAADTMEEHAYTGGDDGVGAAGALDNTGCDALGGDRGGRAETGNGADQGEPATTD